MFIDTAKVIVRAGRGGDGAVSFRHEIYVDKGGPDGGNGGKGGDVIFLASKDENTLLSFRYNPELFAGDGLAGAGRQAAGRSGKDLVVKVPVGTIVRRVVKGADDEGEILADLTFDGERAVIARGGAGGFGNAHFKSSVRQAPKVAELGLAGESFDAVLELRLLADVGLVGFPNAGKSSFLAVVTNAKPEIADYEFTTLSPNLGVATIDGRDILIADIPGLIEGAGDGKGLGTAFLRHIKRTKVILHLIDAYSDDVVGRYKAIRAELGKFDAALLERPEVVALTKTEGFDAELLEMQISALRAATNSPILAISAQAHSGLDAVLREVVKLLSAPVASSSTSGTTAGRLAPLLAEQSSANSPRSALGESNSREEIATITLPESKRAKGFTVEKNDDAFVVRGAEIERFAMKTDLANYDSANRLRDIMKKLGVTAALRKLGAESESLVRIAERELPLIEPPREY
ncbi:MAG: GTPase ObgE [Candidatus Nomurabacteria bacterium]|jgi:GTP-binding protein|nr:GTPase ObgE [Candidatus Nomurabacteria bacterium]